MKSTSLEIIQQIIELREQKKSIRQIADVLSISSSTAHKYVKDLALDLLPGARKKLDEKTINKILEYDDSVTSTKIARDLDLSLSTIIKYRKLGGYKRKLLSEVERRRRGKLSYDHNRRTHKSKCVNYLGGKCVKCGYNKSLNALEFHHRNPEKKEFTISGIKRSWEKTKDELNKCDLLCANCHREVHEQLQEPVQV